MSSVNVADAGYRQFDEVGELQNYLQEQVVPKAADHSRLFSYSGKTPMAFVQSISTHFYPSSNSFGHQLSDDISEVVAQFQCSCGECITPRGSCERSFMVATFTYLMPEGLHALSRTQTIGVRGLGASRPASLPPPHRVIQDRGNVIFVRNRPENNTTFRLHTTCFQFLQRNPPVARLETITFGLDPRHSRTTQTCPAIYLAVQIQHMCDGWDILMEYSKSLLAAINLEVSTDGTEIKQELVRTLFHTLDTWEMIREIHRRQVENLGFLKSFQGNESWFRDTRRKRTYSVDEGFLKLQQALGRLEAVGIDRLVLDTNTLITKTYNLIAIDEAYRSRKQNTSIKRLTWITFIFLPLLFIVSLYGMNIDLTANNPDYTTFFYFAIPLLVFLVICVIILKNIPRIVDTIEAWKKRQRTENDIELQEHGNHAVTGITDPYSVPSWAVERSVFNAQFPNGFGGVDAINRALLEAAVGGSLAMVERLLLEGANVNATVGDDNTTVLAAAAGAGSLALVERLLARGANVNAKCGITNKTALSAAAEGGSLEVVARLLEGGADIHMHYALAKAAGGGHLQVVERLLDEVINLSTGEGVGMQNALEAAAKGGHLEVVKRLFKGGKDLDLDLIAAAAAGSGHLETMVWLLKECKDLNLGLALKAAAGSGNLGTVEWLLNGVITVNDKDREGLPTALAAAAEGGHLAVVQRLLKAGVSDEGDWALDYAASGGHLDVVKCLLKAGVSGNTDFALNYAASGGHLDVVECLLMAGADINSMIGRDREPTLGAAAKSGHLAVVQCLLNAKADPHAEWGDPEQTAVAVAASGGYMEVVKSLLKAGASANPGCPLIQAAKRGHLGIVELLLDEGADINKTLSGGGGCTALETAADGSYLEVVRRLLDRGATLEDTRALNIAAKQGNLEVVELLLEVGVDVNGQFSPNYTTPLGEAAMAGNMAIVQRLLDVGADASLRFRDGKTASNMAARGGHLEIVRLLQAAAK